MPHIADDKENPPKPLRWYRKLAARKGRLEAGVFLAEGDRVIKQISGNNPNGIIEILYTQPLPAHYHSYPHRLITDDQLRYISSAKTPQGIIAVMRLPVETYSDRLPPDTGSTILLLEDIQDPGNLGSLIRSAAAFNFCGVILTEKCADPFSPKVVQSAAGSLFPLWIRRTAAYLKLAGELKSSGYSLIAADLGGSEDPQPLKLHRKLLLVLGNEAAGLSPSVLGVADYRIRIPVMDKKAESLNVAACGAICMYLSRS
ncbi:TrmH family RNA methyltransferase [Chloroflexota bacterium]